MTGFVLTLPEESDADLVIHALLVFAGVNRRPRPQQCARAIVLARELGLALNAQSADPVRRVDLGAAEDRVDGAPVLRSGRKKPGH